MKILIFDFVWKLFDINYGNILEYTILFTNRQQSSLYKKMRCFTFRTPSVTDSIYINGNKVSPIHQSKDSIQKQKRRFRKENKKNSLNIESFLVW